MGKIGNFIDLHPRITTVLLCVGLALAFGFVLSYVTPRETLAVLLYCCQQSSVTRYASSLTCLMLGSVRTKPADMNLHI